MLTPAESEPWSSSAPLMGQLSAELLGTRGLPVSGLCALSPTPGVRGRGVRGVAQKRGRLLLVSSGRITGYYEKYRCREF